MAVDYQYRIVRDGLVLCLDAGNTKSYPGTGTTWFDRSGNGNHGTLVGGVSSSSSNGGIFDLDGIDDYISIPINLTNKAYTVVAAARYKVASGRIVSSNINNWLMGWYAGGTDRYYAEGWVSTGGSGFNSNWICYAATGIPTTASPPGDSWQLYKNGVSVVGPNDAGTNGPNGIRIGAAAGLMSELASCQVSYVLAYNRVLTQSEIQQNFNATRGRFGI